MTLIAAINWAREHASGPVEIRIDHETLFKQLKGEWECNSERLLPLRDKALKLLEETGFQLRYISALENSQARQLCQMAIDQVLADSTSRRQVK